MYLPTFFGDTLFDGLLDGFVPARMTEPMKKASMKTDIKENADGFELMIELPGFKKENIQAELKNGYMTIEAKNEEAKEDKDSAGRYIRRERRFGSVSRSFYVGEDITQEDVKAKFEDGILTLFVPKKEALPAPENKKLIAIEG